MRNRQFNKQTQFDNLMHFLWHISLSVPQQPQLKKTGDIALKLLQ